MKQHIMVDLETMGQGNNAAIVSIGAVYFDEYGLGDTFYRVIDLKSIVSHGGEIDPSTVMWWMKQSDEARSALGKEGEELWTVIQDLCDWIGDDCKMWGNGSEFDNVILANSIRSCGIEELPWKFWNNRCYRTVKSLYRDVKMDRSGTHHNALDDAISQAEHLVKIVNEKGISL